MKSQGHPIRAPLSVVGGTSSEKVKLKVGAGRYEPVTLVSAPGLAMALGRARAPDSGFWHLGAGAEKLRRARGNRHL